MAENPEDFLGELRLSRQLRTTWQVAVVGLAVVLGIVLLVPARIVNLSGWLSTTPALLATLILGLTLLNILELLGGSNERGGTSTLVHEALGGSSGFLSGWTLLGALVLLTAALLGSLGQSLAAIRQVLSAWPAWIALGGYALLVLVNLFHILPRRESLTPLVTLLLIILAALIFSTVPRLTATPPSIPPSRHLLRAVAWSFTLFAGLEAVISSRRRIMHPSTRLPRGLLVLLVLSGLLIGSLTILPSRLPTYDITSGPLGILQALATNTLLPPWSVHVLEGVLLLAAASACLMTAARQLYSLSRDGALPRALTNVRRPYKLPPWIFLSLSLILIPLLIWMPIGWMLDAAAGLFALQAVWINLAAIRSRQAEPERRRTIVVPFYPLVPLLALALSLGLLIALPLNGLVSALVWLTAGTLLLIGYARSHLLEAQHGVLVFGREPEAEKHPGTYRILVPLSTGVERQYVLRLATALAHQTGGELIPLQVVPIADPLAIQEGRRLAEERNTLFQWSTREAERRGVPTYPITRLASSVAKGIQDTAVEEDCDLILLSWPVDSTREGARMSRVVDPVVRAAPCDVAVVAIHTDHLAEQMKEDAEGDDSILDIERVVVTTAGGPHAPLAARLALLLAREYEATTRTVYVTLPEASQEDTELGERRIQNTLDRLRELIASLPAIAGSPLNGEEIPIESQVVTAPSIVEGIVTAGAESDLVFIGASEESLIDQVLFGTLPEQVAIDCLTPVVMVKSYRGLPRFWLQRLWDSIFGALPTLEAEEQLDVYKRVRRDARPDTDFFVMMGLASIISTYGLLQGSSAVIIGGMLVAPLFTPILANSLAIVLGDIRLLRLAVEAALKGIVLAVGLAVVLTVLTPLRTVTQEIASRTSPNLFDLAVALASGAAGAYAVARKDVAAALPGVAIAAALVPPLCVIGIGIALTDAGVTWGGTLLFTTNLIAITLAGSIILLLLGFRPAASPERTARLRLGLVMSLVLLTAISIPLALVFIDSAQNSTTSRTISRTVDTQVAETQGVTLVDFTFDRSSSGVQVTITLNASKPLDSSFADDLQQALNQELGQPVTLDVISVPIDKIHLPPD
ncbi:MAG: DUF389 domain-containing protein [Anaerolineales bacterium]|jgi:uncharacterized hydrophobic protein (TIGR00271 family)